MSQAATRTRIGRPRDDAGRRGRDRLSVVGGLAALSLAAMACVTHRPETVVLVPATAGGAGLGPALPVTAAIAVLPAVLVFPYRRVITAFPALPPRAVRGTPAGPAR